MSAEVIAKLVYLPPAPRDRDAASFWHRKADEWLGEKHRAQGELVRTRDLLNAAYLCLLHHHRVADAAATLDDVIAEVEEKLEALAGDQ